MTKAFTMIELVFSIVIIGILASIALPRLAATRDDAELVKATTTVSALRLAITTERQKRVLRGNFDDITASEAVGLLDYGMSDDWVYYDASNRFVFTGPNDDTCSFVITNNLFKKDTNCTMAGMEKL
jgi:general secretion pathway protein G